ncbi:hypothetical protein CsSME_00019622 [Camellia sinensis var. sinensis]
MNFMVKSHLVIERGFPRLLGAVEAFLEMIILLILSCQHFSRRAYCPSTTKRSK